MKEITTLRSYFEFRAQKGAKVSHALEALETIEAYVQALEMQTTRKANNPHRVLLAKLFIRHLWQIEPGLHHLASLPLPYLAREFLEFQVPFTLDAIDNRADIIKEKGALLVEAALASADEYANIEALAI